MINISLSKLNSLAVSDTIKYSICVLTFIFIAILGYMIYHSRQKAKLWDGLSTARYGSKSANLLILKIYRHLNKFPLTHSYIEKLSYRYRLISPCDNKTIAIKTVGSCLISWTISVGTFFIIYLSNRRLITLIIVMFAIYIINSEVVSRIAKKHEIKILNEMQKMLSDVVHYYYVEYRIDDAIYRARDNLSIDMKAAVDQIYMLLLSSDREEGLSEYYDNIPNKYLRAFVSLCIGIMERGDQLYDGRLLFVRNLENLQREINIEIDKLQRLNMEFMGVILCVVTPVFCIDIVKQFAINLKENMVDFYYGRQGFLLDMGLLVIIWAIYLIMHKSSEYSIFHLSNHKWLLRFDRIGFIKRAMNNYCDKNASKQERLQRELRNSGNNLRARHFILRSFLIALSIFVLSIGIMLYLHDYSRKQLLTVKNHELEYLTSIAKVSQYEAMSDTIETYTRKYIEGQGIIPKNRDELIQIFKRDGIYYNPLISEALADDVLSRMEKYRIDYISFIDFAVCLFISIIAYYIPLFILRYGSSVSGDAIEDEVNQFYALIGMLMYNETITIKQILIEMESFAIIFKQSIRICIDDYASGDMLALNELKEREPYEPFRRIVDNLIRCDAMPVSQAFGEIQLDQDGYMLKRKLANEKSIRKRVIRAYILAAIPFILLFAYGLMPALTSSIKELNQMLMEIEDTTW